MNNIIEQLLQNKIAQQNGEGTSLLNNMWTEQRNQIASVTDVGCKQYRVENLTALVSSGTSNNTTLLCMCTLPDMVGDVVHQVTLMRWGYFYEVMKCTLGMFWTYCIYLVKCCITCCITK